jgi:glycyl-tRNA synthetase beta chain
MGGYYARAQGLPDAVADAIRDHYKPVGQGDEVPTAPVTVAVSLADKLDNLLFFFAIDERPTGSKDPFALRRNALGVIDLALKNSIRTDFFHFDKYTQWMLEEHEATEALAVEEAERLDRDFVPPETRYRFSPGEAYLQEFRSRFHIALSMLLSAHNAVPYVTLFLIERLKVRQRDSGIRHDLVDAVATQSGVIEGDLVRLLARVKALQSFVATEDGANLLVGYRRAANILRKEGYTDPVRVERSRDTPDAGAGPSTSLGTSGLGVEALSYTPEKEEAALLSALDAAEPRAALSVEQEDFEGAMAALASLRAPIDAFFDKVTVNDPDEDKRAARLAMLARIRDAVHKVADFSKIEG